MTNIVYCDSNSIANGIALAMQNSGCTDAFVSGLGFGAAIAVTLWGLRFLKIIVDAKDTSDGD